MLLLKLSPILDEKSASQPFHLDVPTSPSENLAAVASSQQESAGSR
jgi:hypothetical protein